MNYNILIAAIIFSTIAQAQQFTGSFDLLLSQERKNDSSAMTEKQDGDTISYYFSKEKVAIIIHPKRNQPDLRLVFSTADSTITGLFEMSGKKGGYILPMNEKYWPGMPYALRDYGTVPKMELDYSGEQKEINGYNSLEIRCKNEEYEMYFWVTDSIPLTLTQVIAYQTVGAGEDVKNLKMLAKCGIQAFAMRTELDAKEDKRDVIITVTNFSEEEVDPALFSDEEHTLSDMRKEQ